MEHDPNKRSGEKILIISLSGIGDLILFTPALPRLRKKFPEGEISLLVKKKEAAQVVKGHPCLDKVIVHDPQRASLGENLRFYLNLRKQRYDLSLSVFPAMTALNNLSTLAIGARERWVYCTGRPWRSLDFLNNRRIPYRHGKHRIEYNLAMVKAIVGEDEPYPAEDPREQVYIYYRQEPEQRARSDQTLHSLGLDSSQPLVGIHAGSGDDQPFKRWDEEKFALLADRIQTEFPFQVVLLGGPEEEGLSQRIARQMKTRPPAIAAGRCDLEQTLGLISRCGLLISNDSGVMNMAFALRTRILAIFGPTDDTCTRPLGNGDAYILKELPCKPKCRIRYLYSKKCSLNYRCLKELSVDEVWETARKMLESLKR
ncbi:MAG: glycosyltransferase family 9 protein [bacterium]|nr:glycosyltransferase family 9 protein [bacterium]